MLQETLDSLCPRAPNKSIFPSHSPVRHDCGNAGKSEPDDGWNIPIDITEKFEVYAIGAILQGNPEATLDEPR
jgi:hypothetical protein